MKHFKFAILGDTHACSFRGRDSELKINSSGRMPDYFRYTEMTRDVLPVLAREIHALEPEILFSTGDFIEGGGDDEFDFRNAISLFSPCAKEFYYARGSHDLKTPLPRWKKIVHENCVFLLLDYTDWNGSQKAWLVSELTNAKSKDLKIFVLAHPPLHLFGRHFFYSESFSRDVETILRENPADVYFCGHTHNQVLSFRDGTIQITGSSVGYLHSTEIPLEELHSIPEHLKKNYIWGIPEDFAPAFWFADVSDEGIRLERHNLRGVSGSLIQKKRFSMPEILTKPEFSRTLSPLVPEDFLQIRCGWLNLFPANRGAEKGTNLNLNGIPLGKMPPGMCYASRRFVLLPEQALAALTFENELEIAFPDSDLFAYGSFSLELHLLDGRTVRSEVAPEKFVCGVFSDFEYAKKDSIPVRKLEKRKIHLHFLKAE